MHPSHKRVRSSDASTFDLICDDCGATDQVPGGWGSLAHPCTYEHTNDLRPELPVTNIFDAPSSDAYKAAWDNEIRSLPDWVPDICIYHGNCLDGFTAAWAVRKKWPGIQFYGATHGSHIDINVVGKNVLMVDFAPKLRDMHRWQTEPASLVVIDHHKTAEADLEGVYKFKGGPKCARYALDDTTRNGRPPIIAWFDMDHSGARLAWDFVTVEDTIPHDFVNRPKLVDYVEDRDLWRFDYANTKAFTAYLANQTMNFARWDIFANAGNEPDILNKGAVILQSERMIRDGLKKEAYWFEFILKSPGSRPDTIYKVPVVNAPYHFASELANEILVSFGDAPFAACWFRRADGKVQWSLRSADDRADVSKIARSMGGGGHRNAAGFECHPDVMQGDNIVVMT